MSFILFTLWTILFLVIIGYSNIISINCLYRHIIIKFYLLYWIVLFNWFVVLRVINIWGNSSVIVFELIVLVFNWVNMLLLIIVLLCSSLILLFSIDYLSIIEGILFIIYILLFQFIMLLLLLSSDLIILFLIWDLLGLVSYLLINFYLSKVNCGIKAVILNRFGDVLILYLLSFINSLLCVLGLYCSLLISLFILVILLLIKLIYSWLVVCLLTIMFTKSAQFPFISWLLNAMNAPTPVSALLHSSTMVIAGIYYAIIFIIILLLVYCSLYLIFISISLIWSLFKACSSNDIKTIIALSTINQLSYMFFCLIINIILTLFHIIFHSLFKMNLFLTSNAIIHNSIYYQSIIKLKFISLFINIIYTISLSLLILAQSKELIILYSYIVFSFSILSWFMILASFFTLIYSIFLFYCLFVY